MRCGNCGQESSSVIGGKCPRCGASASRQEYFHAPASHKNAPPKTKRQAASQKRQQTAVVKKVATKKQPPRAAVKDTASPRKAPPQKPASTASKTAKPKQRRQRSKILFVVLLFWGLLALAVFNTNFTVFSDDNRYLQTGEGFIRALIEQDETTLTGYVHSNMRGNLYPLHYQSVTSCTVQGTVSEEENAEALGQELREQYGIKDTVVAARWIIVEYTVEADGKTESCIIDVLVANINGDIYAVKTRNMTDVPTPTTT